MSEQLVVECIFSLRKHRLQKAYLILVQIWQSKLTLQKKGQVLIDKNNGRKTNELPILNTVAPRDAYHHILLQIVLPICYFH